MSILFSKMIPFYIAIHNVCKFDLQCDHDSLHISPTLHSYTALQ